MLEFMEAADSWGLRKGVDVSFFRDEYEGWLAKLAFRDARGPYSGIVSAFERRAKTKATPEETIEKFRDRVDRLMSRTAQRAHQSRLPQRSKSVSQLEVRI